MKRTLNRSGAFALVFALNLVLFVLFTMPFKLWVAASEVTQMRPASALTPVLGMIFGWPAALGCAAGNLICDLSSGYETLYAVLNSLLQVLYAMAAYFFWKRLNHERDGQEFRLDSVERILKFCLLLALNAILTVLCTGWLNHRYAVADLISMDNVYQLINCFDAGLLFGAPLLIVGHLLQCQLENLKSGKKEKVVQFSMNERMILNTIITGLGICTLVGLAVYLMDKYGERGVGLWGRIYLFETLALNVYFALSVGMMRFTEQRISRPIEHLAHIAGTYYAERSTDGQRERMIAACEKYARDSTEVGELARSYISMVQDLGSYVENLKTVLAEKERINAELNLASDIQAHMLPCIFPPFPEYSEFDLYAIMDPAKEVGGDFYDFYMIGENKLAVTVADVSGKGVPAALFMVIAKTLLKNYAQMGLEPNKVFETVNRLLCDGNDAGLFVTAWMGVLELSSGTMTYVNAGQNPPLVKRADGQFEYLRQRTGFVLAGMEGARYRQNTLHFAPGDRLLLYTDGVTEATTPEQELYGESRLQAFMNDHAKMETAPVLQALRKDLDAFAGTAPQFDDITLLLLDFRGFKGNEMEMTQKTFAASVDVVSEVIAFVETEMERAGCPIKTQMAICVAMEELFVNIAQYAYPEGTGSAQLAIGVDKNTNTATFVLTDRGVPFDPLEQQDPDITKPAEEREIGGLGIFIVKKTMDTVRYERVQNKNQLTMTKKLSS